MQTKRNDQNKGFTIIELILFLAVSMTMLTIGFSAISGRTADVQFTDSIRTLESQLRRNLSNVGFGLNLRGDFDCEEVGGALEFVPAGPSLSPPAPGKNLNCVANGTKFTFDTADQEGFRVEAVASLDDRDDERSSLEDLGDKLTSGLTAVIPGTNQDIMFNWQTRFVGAYVVGRTPPGVSSVEFMRLRALESSAEYLFARTDPAHSFEALNLTGEEFVLCFEGENNRRASVVVNEEARFQANFEDSRCDGLNP